MDLRYLQKLKVSLQKPYKHKECPIKGSSARVAKDETVAIFDRMVWVSLRKRRGLISGSLKRAMILTYLDFVCGCVIDGCCARKFDHEKFRVIWSCAVLAPNGIAVA